MASALAWNWPGRAGSWPGPAAIGCSFASHVHAICSLVTLPRLMSARAEYLCAPALPPQASQLTAGLCASALAVQGKSANNVRRIVEDMEAMGETTDCQGLLTRVSGNSRLTARLATASEPE